MRMREQYQQEITALHDGICTLGQDVIAQIERAIDALEQNATDKAREVVAGDAAIDAARNRLAEHIGSVMARQQPVARDLRHFLAGLEIANELERIGDYAKSLAKVTLRDRTLPHQPPELPFRETAERAIAMLRVSLDAFARQDASGITALAEDDDRVDALEDTMRGTLYDLIQREPNAAAWGVDRILAAHTLERIADRSTNLAERAVFFIGGQRVELNN